MCIAKAESELRNSLPRGISCDRIEALQSGVSTFVFDSMKRFRRASLPDDFWVSFIRSTGVVGWCEGAVYLTSLGRPTDIGLQLGKACYPCSG